MNEMDTKVLIVTNNETNDINLFGEVIEEITIEELIKKYNVSEDINIINFVKRIGYIYINPELNAIYPTAPCLYDTWSDDINNSLKNAIRKYNINKL